MSEKVIMSAGDVGRTLARIAHEIVECNDDPEQLVLVGMHTRGVPLARRLVARVARFGGLEIPIGTIDISPYRDDILPIDEQPIVKRTDVPDGVEGRSVILVDDVLYTGRSVRAAMDAVIDIGRPRSIQFAVLVDRGHRELPVRADYVGKNVPSSRHEEIRVRLVETDGVDQVAIVDKIASAVP